jgi:C_GCAxxG_C_C family probable redox protein
MTEKDKKELSNKAYKLGYEYEQTYKGCAQCIVAAVQDTLDIRNDDIFKGVTACSGGGGSLCDTGCGAYVGGVVLLSTLWGRERDNFADPDKVRSRTSELARKLHARFIEEYGAVICRDIHMKLFGRFFYMADPEEAEKFDAAGAHSTVCPEVVGKAAKWVTEIILEENLLPER